MPRRRRNRNQKRWAGECGGRADGKCDERSAAERERDEAPRPAEGLRADPLTVAILNENLQTTRAGRTDGERRNADKGAANDERMREINGKINSVATPPLSVAEPNILNNLTPRRIVRAVRAEPYIDNLCTSSSTALLRSNRRPHRIRSNSSASKLRSPGVERTPITVDASTQTEWPTADGSPHLRSCVNIFETPKAAPLDLNRARLRKLKHFGEMLYGDECGNLSDPEVSFRGLMDVSTPIRKKVDNVATPQNAAKTNNAPAANDKNSTVGSSRPREKVKAKRFEASLVTKRRYKAVSPRMGRESEPRAKRPPIPKSFTPPRAAHCKPTENILNVSAEQGRSVTRPKRFHTRFVAQWIARISEICSWLGLSLKKTLSATKRVYEPKLPEDPVGWPNPAPQFPAVALRDRANGWAVPCNNCEEHRLKLVVLSSKVEVLERELSESTAEGRETISALLGEIAKIRSELSEIGAIKKQLREMEETIKAKPVAGAATQPPPPPPPPCAPPVPPPPPPPMLSPKADTPATRPRSGGAGSKRPERKSTNENSRPVISLDDILKVKLKKTTDKPLSARRAQQPLISVEMLSQIKLRPTSRPETPYGPAKDAPPLSGSPATSLSKILSGVETASVRRVKRLRRANGYSLDDFSRRRALRREWSGSDDT